MFNAPSLGYRTRRKATIVALDQAELQQVIDHVKGHLHQILTETVPDLVAAPHSRDRDLLDRMVRVEEELKNLRETMERRFQAQHELIASQQEAIASEFRAVDKRFDDVNRRFEDVNKRFDDVNKRFEDVNRRFEDVDKRFEDVNKRFEDVNRRFALIQWMGVVGFATIAAMTAVVGLIGLGAIP